MVHEHLHLRSDDSLDLVWVDESTATVHGPAMRRAAELLALAFEPYLQECLLNNKPPPSPVRITARGDKLVVSFTLPPSAMHDAVVRSLGTDADRSHGAELVRTEDSSPGAATADGWSILSRVRVAASGLFTLEADPKRSFLGVRRLRLEIDASEGLSDTAAADVARAYRAAHGTRGSKSTMPMVFEGWRANRDTYVRGP